MKSSNCLRRMLCFRRKNSGPFRAAANSRILWMSFGQPSSVRFYTGRRARFLLCHLRADAAVHSGQERGAVWLPCLQQAAGILHFPAGHLDLGNGPASCSTAGDQFLPAALSPFESKLKRSAANLQQTLCVASAVTALVLRPVPAAGAHSSCRAEHPLHGGMVALQQRFRHIGLNGARKAAALHPPCAAAALQDALAQRKRHRQP